MFLYIEDTRDAEREHKALGRTQIYSHNNAWYRISTHTHFRGPLQTYPKKVIS